MAALPQEHDPAQLLATACDSNLATELRKNAWFRYETVMWYHGYRSRGLRLDALDKTQREAVYEYIKEQNVRALNEGWSGTSI